MSVEEQAAAWAWILVDRAEEDRRRRGPRAQERAQERLSSARWVLTLLEHLETRP